MKPVHVAEMLRDMALVEHMGLRVLWKRGQDSSSMRRRRNQYLQAALCVIGYCSGGANKVLARRLARDWPLRGYWRK